MWPENSRKEQIRSLIKVDKPGMVVYAFSHSTREAEASLSYKASPI